MPDYEEITHEFETLVNDLGVKKQEIQKISEEGGDDQHVKAALDAVDKLFRTLETKVKTQLSTEERQRKIEQLKADIKILELIDATDPDFNRRIEAERSLALLNSQLSLYLTHDVLRFEDLLDENQIQLKTAIAQAAKDIQARRNLARVLKGIEVGLRVAGFAFALAAKLAITAAKL